MDFVDKISDWQSHAREQIKLIEMDPEPKEEDTKIAESSRKYCATRIFIQRLGMPMWLIRPKGILMNNI